jgi:hypothetical protein
MESVRTYLPGMGAREEAQAVLADFAPGLELERQSLDKNDSCQVGLDNDLLVYIDYSTSVGGRAPRGDGKSGRYPLTARGPARFRN